MKKALLIIDVQNDYFAGGKYELVHPDEALNMIKRLLRSFRAENLPVFYVQHLSDSNANFFIPETLGSCIHDAITPLENEKIIVKNYPNSFYKTDLQKELRCRNHGSRHMRNDDAHVCGHNSTCCKGLWISCNSSFRYMCSKRFKLERISSVCRYRS